ncbi:MAG: hypothetical protein OXC63_12490, partial [Aestuariivita sp.]|nr:hypothetical protein [Aestuariivita sp.]
MAAPVWAQTTVTSSGREGPTACMGGRAEIDAANAPITALSTSGGTVTVPGVTWGSYVGRFGDGGRPTGSATVAAAIYNAETGVRRGGLQSFAFISSGSNYSGGSMTMSGLEAKTPYYVEFSVNKSGFEDQVFARRCFMTGGNYTMTVNPASGQTSGCFAISPRTPQDVRNCWCGRASTLPLFGDGTDNSNFLDSIG